MQRLSSPSSSQAYAQSHGQPLPLLLSLVCLLLLSFNHFLVCAVINNIATSPNRQRRKTRRLVLMLRRLEMLQCLLHRFEMLLEAAAALFLNGGTQHYSDFISLLNVRIPQVARRSKFQILNAPLRVIIQFFQVLVHLFGLLLQFLRFLFTVNLLLRRGLLFLCDESPLQFNRYLFLVVIQFVD